MREFPQTPQQEPKPLSHAEMAKFKTQVVSGFVWLLHTIEETERARRTQPTQFDIPIQERLRRAS
jgi:hypothetical protein